MNILSDFVRTCEEIWLEICLRNPDAGNCIIVVASGGRKAPNLYGHFAKERWQFKDENIHEILLVAENLKRSAEEVFTTLLHEAVHSINNTREIKDVAGRRHNKKFARCCEEVGLVPPTETSGPLGYSAATLSDEAKVEYGAEIKKLDEALVLCRNLQLVPKTENKNIRLFCDCYRKLVVSPKVHNEGAIACVLCGTEFKPEEEDD